MIQQLLTPSRPTHRVPQKILRTNLSSELKLTANAFGAEDGPSTQLPLSAKPVGQMRQVARRSADSRIGPKSLTRAAGVFPKDILNLVPALLPSAGGGELLESVVVLNTWQQHRIARMVVQKLFGTVTGSAWRSLALSPNTDTREAIRFAFVDLLEEGAPGYS